MNLIDRIIQCRKPFVIESLLDGSHTRVSGAMDAASDLMRSPIRYVLDDALTSMCTDLAYSNGATVMSCADLIRVPAESLWVEWCNKPWLDALVRNHLNPGPQDSQAGRYGIFIRSAKDGRQGVMRAFWALDDRDVDVQASATLARFYLDQAEAAVAPEEPGVLRVAAPDMDPDGILSRCLHFEFEDTWDQYYRRVAPDASLRLGILHQSIGIVALAVPVLMAFFLLLATRAGLPQHQTELARLNRARIQRGRVPLAEHIQVSAPLFPPYHDAPASPGGLQIRRHPRLHHVRGHLVRRNDRLIWRVPHLRGRSDAGKLKSRTVEWRFEAGAAQRCERNARGSLP